MSSRGADALRMTLADFTLSPPRRQTRARRQELVRKADAAGIPKREIARLLGVSRPTVYSDLKADADERGK